MADTGVYMFTIKTLSSWKVEGGRWKVEGGSPLQTVGQAVAAGDWTRFISGEIRQAAPSVYTVIVNIAISPLDTSHQVRHIQ